MAYRIRTVSELTGIPKNTLIAWERRYGFIRPERHENGYRSYSEEDVDRILRVRNALKAGLKISEAVELLKSGTPVPAQRGESSSQTEDEIERACAQLRAQLVQALIRYRAQEAERLLGQLLPLSFEERLHRVYFPALREIGDMWERGEVNVAQEHFAAAIIRNQLVAILIGLGARNTFAPHAACTTFPGEHHEIAAIALGVHLGLRGYQVAYLGADLPLLDLIDFAQKQRPSLVCVSTINSTPREVLLDYAAKLRASCPESTRLVIGGRGAEHDPPLESPGVEFVPHWHDFVGSEATISRAL